MNQRTRRLLAALGAIALAFVLGFEGRAIAKQPLTVGGSAANFGVQRLSGGFLPDPTMVQVRAGGTIGAASMGLGAGCRGFVTEQPDLVVAYLRPGVFLRFFVRAAGDTSLIVHDPSGRWSCGDDVGRGNLNPMVDVEDPRAGQYDVWIGSPRSGETVAGTLYVSELRSQRP